MAHDIPDDPYEQFDLSEPDDAGVGAAQNMRGVVVPEGVAVCGISIPPNTEGYPPGPAILLIFRVVCAEHGRVELVKYAVPDGNTAMNGREATGEGLRAFADLIAGVADKLADPDLVADGQRRALDALAADIAGLEPALAPQCPGCGARLFGDIAKRGACLACFPESVPDDVIAAAARLGS